MEQGFCKLSLNCLTASVILILLSFYHTAWGSTTSDSKTERRASDFDWSFSSRQGADHKYDFWSPDWVSTQESNPRLLVQPGHVPPNGKRWNVNFKYEYI